MLRVIKRYFAIRSYVLRLSLDLARRFGLKSEYTIEQVSQAMERGGFEKAFAAYAHAAFCSRREFAEYYEPLGVKCTYDGLRYTIAKRYFDRRADFDAATIIRRMRGSTAAAGGPFQTEESGNGECNS